MEKSIPTFVINPLRVDKKYTRHCRGNTLFKKIYTKYGTR